MLNSAQAALLAERTDGLDPDRLIACVRACGFDENAYLANHADLQSAGFDAPQALHHFLAQGYAQNRNVTCGVLPDVGVTASQFPLETELTVNAAAEEFVEVTSRFCADVVVLPLVLNVS